MRYFSLFNFCCAFLFVDGRRFLVESPIPRYPEELKLTLTPTDLNAVPKDKEYGSAWERSGLFEGDIMTSPDDMRNVVNDPSKRWQMPIPVYINALEFDQNGLAIIERALSEIEQRTCVRFRQYQMGDPSFIVVRSNANGCWSMVGRKDGGQVVHLQQPGCMVNGIVVHEFLHALGLYHQQSSPDRDQYIMIHWENIEAGREHNFNKYTTSEVSTLNQQYDYGSVMHYGATAFSSNGQPTITPRRPGAQIGQRKTMSELDAMKIRMMYGCPAYAEPSNNKPDPDDKEEEDYEEYEEEEEEDEDENEIEK